MRSAAISSAQLARQSTDDLIAARELVERILDFRARQHHLFDPPAALSREAIPQVLSPSSVSCFQKCSAQWYYRKVLRLPETRNAALALGSAVHEAIAGNFVQKIETGSDLPYSHVREMFRAALATQFEEGGIVLEAEETREDVAECGEMLARVYLEQAAPSIQPAAVEMPVEGAVGGVRVHGFVDVLTVDGTVVDLKTAAKKPSSIAPAHKLQVSTYSMLAPGANGRGRRDVVTKTKTVAHYRQSFEVSPADRKYAERLYSITFDQMHSGLIAPNRDSPMCSRRYCSHWQRCQDDFGGEVAE